MNKMRNKIKGGVRLDTNKKIMNPMRIEILKIIKERGETNENGVATGNMYSRKSIKLAIHRLAELDFIKFTGGGYFKISEKGMDFLAQ